MNEFKFTKTNLITIFISYYDEQGVLYYHDRLKDLIKYNNVHIYPNAIEEIIYQHDDVIEAGQINLNYPSFTYVGWINLPGP